MKLALMPSTFFSTYGIYNSLFDKTEYAWTALLQINSFISTFKKSTLSKEFKEIRPNVFVGKNVEIDSSARIEGGAIIGHNVSIGHAAYLRAGVLLSDNVHIGHAVEVKHSIVLSGSSLAHLNYAGDSIIGNNCNIAGGAILANFRFDKKTIGVKLNKKVISTQMEKFGGVLGDNCLIGVNAVLNPGTILGKNTIVYPLICVKGVHFKSEIIR